MTDFARYRYVDTLPRREKALRLVWEIVHGLMIRPTPRWAMHGWRRALLRLFGAQVGPGCRIDPSCAIWAPWNLRLGDYVALGAGVDCYCIDVITIGSKTTISQRAFLCAGSHTVEDLKRPLVTRPISIGDHAWIAAEVMVLPGVNIGDGVVVGARSLVVGDLPPWTVCMGNPCSVRRKRALEGELPIAATIRDARP